MQEMTDNEVSSYDLLQRHVNLSNDGSTKLSKKKKNGVPLKIAQDYTNIAWYIFNALCETTLEKLSAMILVSPPWKYKVKLYAVLRRTTKMTLFLRNNTYEKRLAKLVLLPWRRGHTGERNVWWTAGNETQVPTCWGKRKCGNSARNNTTNNKPRNPVPRLFPSIICYGQDVRYSVSADLEKHRLSGNISKHFQTFPMVTKIRL